LDLLPVFSLQGKEDRIRQSGLLSCALNTAKGRLGDLVSIIETAARHTAIWAGLVTVTQPISPRTAILSHLVSITASISRHSGFFTNLVSVTTPISPRTAILSHLVSITASISRHSHNICEKAYMLRHATIGGEKPIFENGYLR